MIPSYLLTHLNNNVLCLNICCNYNVLKIIWRLLVFTESSFTRSSFEHRCMNNIKKIYQYAGKCEDQQNLNYILEAALLSTPEGFTDNSPNVHMPSSTVKKPSATQSLCLYTIYWMLNLKQQNVVLWLHNPNEKPWKWVIAFGQNKKKRKGHSKINEQIKRNLYTWITRHGQVFQSPIYNDCLKVLLDDQTEPQLFPFFLLQVSVR